MSLEPIRSRRLRSVLLGATGALWVIGLGVGLKTTLNYETAPAAPGSAPKIWPAKSTIRRVSGLSTIVVMAHPHCPCTRATIGELALLMARLQNRVAATVGTQAVTTLEHGEFDLVLMDIQMPELNGLEATKMIRTKEVGTGRHVPIVAMTAHAMKGDQDACIAAGMDGYLSKPIRAAELFETIERHLGAKSQTAVVRSAPGPGGLPFDEANILERVGGDQHLFNELISTFLAECPRLMTSVRQATIRKDAKEVYEATHKLKGAVCNLTDKGAFEAASQLETLARVEDLRHADQVLQKLELEMGRLVAALMMHQTPESTKALGAAN